MDNLISRLAYAKVNLHLAVGAPFSDGYHPIESIFALVDLADTLRMTYRESDDFSFSVTGLEIYCEKGKDTLTKAAFLWYERSQHPLSIHVHCEKHIPVQAGLGGGSSDAASMLLLLQEAAGEQALGLADLQEVALRVGCDVPFFLSGFSCALVGGRGEKISELLLEHKHILLAQPTGYSVSTKEAYALIDGLLQRGELGQRVPLQAVLATLKQMTPTWSEVFFNDFEKCVEAHGFYETVRLLGEKHNGFGCLSGSGSCWYFISENGKTVLELCNEFNNRFMDSVQLWCTKLI